MNKSGRGGWPFIAAGLLLLACAAGLTAYNLYDNSRAGNEADAVSQALAVQIESRAALTRELQTEQAAELASDSPPAGQEAEASEEYREMALETVDGNDYIGILEVPSMHLSLPVMYEWDERRLKISPCRYAGSYYTDDLVICAHNYRRHFSPLRSISTGADVWLHTADGQDIHYIAVNVETIRPTAIEQMLDNDKNSDSESSWDLTLFTCTIGGQARWTLRCERAD